MIIRSRHVVFPDGVRAADVVVVDGKIAEIKKRGSAKKNVEDIGDLHLMPGLVDVHVHVNEPGRTEWEGYFTATQAAAAGGITTILDMPLNSIPATTTLSAFRQKLTAARGQLWIDCGFYGGVVPGNTAELGPMIEAGVFGFKTFLIESGVDEFPYSTEEDVRKALPVLASKGVPLLVHAELDLPREKHLHADPKSYSTYLASRPKKWENEAIALIARLTEEYRGRTHIVHLSSSEGIEIVSSAKRRGLSMSAETCPHYLTFAAEEIPYGDTFFKCAPPIREKENRERLWKGLANGAIDFIAADHSPCTPALKAPNEGDFSAAWGGISSLQYTLPVVWTEAANRGHSISDVTRWMASAPATWAGLSGKKGEIAVENDADFVAFDPEKSWTIGRAGNRHRHPVTPYEGRVVKGKIEKTFLRGESVYDRGDFMGRPSGQRLLKKEDRWNMQSEWIDLAAERVGGKTMSASDEFFAPKENLLKPGRGIFIPEKFTDNGKWMDGWESRRKRVPGNDWCIIRLGLPGKIHGVDIDTNHFLGNHPPFASVEAATVENESEGLIWAEILPKSPLKPGSQNLFNIKDGSRRTHIRLNIFPDGGVARFRVYGEVLPDWAKVPEGNKVDLAAVENGGRVLICNDMFFGPKDNLIMPGRAENMGDGWETKRKREPGYDWVIVKLGAPGSIQLAEVDTNHFKGNFPDQCSLEGANAPDVSDEEIADAKVKWTEILPKTKLSAHTRHFFEKELKSADATFTHVRMNIFPDGGVSRLRLYGVRK